MRRAWIGLCLLAVLLLAPAAIASPVVHARVDRALDSYVVNRDLTYTRVVTEDTTLLTPRALRLLDRSTKTFYPEKQALEVVEAWVDHPDGERIPVEKSSIFTRPSAASQSAPGFVNSLTTTVLFPQLKPGDRTHIVWRFVQKTPGLLGFNTHNLSGSAWDTGIDETRIEIPADVPLHWRARGGYAVEDTTENGIRRVIARIENTGAQEDEPAAVSGLDFRPVFLATSQPNLEAVGAIVDQASRGRADPTPEIAALAGRIAGELTGLDAARAIHAWVVKNIRYVAVYLSPDDGWVPHPAAEVLKAGYGDCKDYVVLMRALLAARGIESHMAAVDWGTRYADPPLWVPYFNHAILYLPGFDRYLNPTDRNAGFDALDQRLAGKQVLIVTKEGRVARTPAATPDTNRYRYIAQVVLTPEGGQTGIAWFEMSPNQEIPIRSRLGSASSMEDLARRWLATTPEGGFGAFQASDPADVTRPLALTASWRSLAAVNVQGNETFLRVPTGLDLAPAAWERAKLSANGKRETPLAADIRDSVWETSIVLSPDLRVARLPPDVDLSTSLGRYTAQYRRDGGVIHIRRALRVERQVVEPAAYPAYERLILAASVDARAVIVLGQEDR